MATPPPRVWLPEGVFDALERGLEEWSYVLDDSNPGEYDEVTLARLRRDFDEAWKWLHPDWRGPSVA